MVAVTAATVRYRSGVAAGAAARVHGKVVQGLAQGAGGRHPARQLSVSSHDPSSCSLIQCLVSQLCCWYEIDGFAVALALGLKVSAGSFSIVAMAPVNKYSSCWWPKLSSLALQFTDCSLAGALGLLRILIYKVKVYADGTTTMSTHERKASIRNFYGMMHILWRSICIERYRRQDEDQKMVISEIDDNIEEECGICMEINSKVVLPTCSHAMCIKCYRDWRSRSQSCPFCRNSLKRVNSADLWIYTDNKDIVDMGTVRRENLRRLSLYIDKLPTVIPETVFDVYDSHVK
ncbi:hypothetical protein ABZP36_001614 [Zizania latifolia]